MGMKPGDIFAERVTQRLRELNWSQETLAKALGIKPTGVSKVLTEKRSPKLDSLIAWAEALHVSAGWLVGSDTAPTPPARMASAAQIEALRIHAEGIGLSEDRLALVRFALGAKESAVRVTVRGLPAGE